MGLLDTLLMPRTAKAETGIGAVWMATDLPISSVTRNPLKRMAEAQAVHWANRWIRSAERIISDRFATVTYHLEDGDDQEIGDDAPPNLKAIRDLIERPYSPAPGDPGNSTPRTRSQLWKLTSRHMGVCGVSYWYLDQTEALAGTPLQLLYINPARLKPAMTDDGLLLGWVLDPDARGGGMPLERDKVLPFYLEPTENGWHDVHGLVDTAMSMNRVQTYGDRHSSQSLASGGRIPGIFSPKDGAIPPDVFDQLVRDVRNISDSPDASKRSLILRGAVDFTKTAATPQELDFVAVMEMGKKETYELWGVPLTMAGGIVPQGIGGESKSLDEAILWQNAVGPRVRTFREVIQFELLDRYKALGIEVELEIEEPEFDDDTPMYDRAEKAMGQPLTFDERRELLGKEPLGGDFGRSVFLPINLVLVGMGPDPSVPGAIGALTEEEPPAPIPAALAPFTEPAKAGLDPVRKHTIVRMQRDVGKVLAAMGKEVSAKVAERAAHLAKKPTDVRVWWNAERWTKELEKALRPHAALAAETVGEQVQARFAKADVGLSQRVLTRLLGAVGARIKEMVGFTRDEVQNAIGRGIDEGLSPAQLGERIAALGVFGEARAETIARTETATVLNRAATESYREFGVSEVTVDDGDADDVCAEANGATWSLEEAEENPIGHPNCVRSFSPVLGSAKAMTAPLLPAEKPPAPPQVINVNFPAQPPQTFHIHEGEVTVEPTPVTFTAGDIYLPEQSAAVVHNAIHLPEPKAMVVTRDHKDRITGVVPADGVHGSTDGQEP